LWAVQAAVEERFWLTSIHPPLGWLADPEGEGSVAARKKLVSWLAATVVNFGAADLPGLSVEQTTQLLRMRESSPVAVAATNILRQAGHLAEPDETEEDVAELLKGFE
jgi:hypothetical protein